MTEHAVTRNEVMPRAHYLTDAPLSIRFEFLLNTKEGHITLLRALRGAAFSCLHVQQTFSFISLDLSVVYYTFGWLDFSQSLRNTHLTMQHGTPPAASLVRSVSVDVVQCQIKPLSEKKDPAPARWQRQATNLLF